MCKRAIPTAGVTLALELLACTSHGQLQCMQLIVLHPVCTYRRVAILEAMLSLKPEKRPGYTDIVNNPLFAHLIQSGKLHPRALRHRVARADRVVRGRADASMESMEVVQVQHLDLHRAISASDFTDDL